MGTIGIPGRARRCRTSGRLGTITSTSTRATSTRRRGPQAGHVRGTSRAAIGDKGGDGDNWYSGVGAPLSNLGKIGDWYLQFGTGDVHKKTGTASWTRQGNIKGGIGDKGGDGDNWHSGAGAPLSNLGKIGDYYLDLDTGDVHKKTKAAAWTRQGNIKGGIGDKGGDGDNWHDGHGAPAGNLGKIGDYYLDLDTGDVHKKTAPAVWTLQGNIKGGDGDNWHSGAGEPANSLGKVGDWYIDGATGDLYQKTGTASWTLRVTLRPPTIRVAISGYRVLVTAPEEAALATVNTLTGALLRRANNATQGDNLIGDVVFFYRSGFARSFAWEGSTWRVMDRYIAAELIQAASLTALNVTVRNIDIGETLTAEHVDANLRNARVLWRGSGQVDDQTQRYGFTMGADMRDYDVLSGTALVLPNRIYAPFSIPTDPLVSGTINALPSGWSRFACIGGAPGYDTAIFYVWRSADGRSLFMQPHESDEDAIFTVIIGFKNPLDAPASGFQSVGRALVLTTRVETVHRRASSTPAAPGGGAVAVLGTIPNGWQRTEPVPTSTQNVYSLRRTVTLRNGVFRSSTAWGSVTKVADKTGTTTTTTTPRRVETIYRRASSTPSAPGGGTTAGLGTIPSGWQRTEPVPTSTQNVYRARRTVTLLGTRFQSSTAWGSVTKVADKTGTTTAIITRRVETIYRQTTLVLLSAPAGGATAALGTIPSGWQRTMPVRKFGEDIYRAKRTVRLRYGVWDSSTAWSGLMIVKRPPGVAPSVPRLVTGRYENGVVQSWSWRPPLVGTQPIVYEYIYGQDDDKGAWKHWIWSTWTDTSSLSAPANGSAFLVRAKNAYGKSNWVPKY